MKIKLSKKMLSCVLAFIMVVASVPFMGISAPAAVEEASSELVDLYNACLDYAAMLRNLTTVKTNMLQAYEAYTDARTYHDLSEIGVYDGSLVQSKIDALKEAMGKMGDYTPNYTFAKTAADNSYTSLSDHTNTLVDGDQMLNVLYAYGVGGTSTYNSATTDSTEGGVQYGPVVFLYDEGLMAVPVSNWGKRASGTRTKRVRYMYPTTDGFYLNKLWHGYSTDAGYITQTGSRLGFQAGDQDHYTDGSGTTMRYSNTLYYRGVLADNEYLRTIPSVTWHFQNNTDNEADITQNAPIYILNYKTVNDRLVHAAQEVHQANLLTTAAAQDFLGEIDDLTSLNFNVDYSDTANAVAGVESAIRTAVENYDGLDFAEAGLMYSLSDIIGVTKPVYDEGNDTGLYTEKSWGTYKAAYEAAYNAVAAVQNNGYTLSQDSVDTLQKNLENAIAGLTYASHDLADTTEFDKVESYVYSLSAAYYTDTYTNLLQLLDEQVKVVYPDGRVKAPLSAEEQYKVDGATLAVWDAIKTLRLTSRGLEELIEEAKTYDGNMYMGYAGLQEAMAKAEDYVKEMAEREFPATQDNYETAEADEYAKYQEVCNELRAAIDALYLAFTSISNGTVVNETRGSTSGVNDSNVTVYLSGAITHKTYFKTEPGQQKFVTDYDLTIDNTFDRFGSSGAQFHGLGFGALGSSMYSNSNLGSISIEWVEGGAAGAELESTYHNALMKTAVTQDTNYIDIVANTRNQKIFGYTTVTAGDLGLQATDFVTPDIYELYWIRRAASGNQTKTPVNSDVKQTITIIDVSSLFSLINQADEFMDKAYNNYYGCYNEAVWTNFVNALAAAKDNMNYETMSNDAIVTECTSRYNNLNTAMNTLKMSSSINQDVTKHLYDTVVDTEPGCTTSGHQTDTCSICGFEYAHDVEATGHTFVYTPDNNGHSHTVTCSKCDLPASTEECTDYEENGFCDSCRQYLYDPAIWEAYNSAQQNLIAALSGKNTIDSVSAVKDAIDKLTFFAYTSEEKDATTADSQDAIDAEVAKIIEAQTLLVPVDSSVYDALEKTVDTLNADAYNIDVVKGVKDSAQTTQTFNIAGVDYYGYDFDDAITKIKTAMNDNQYDYNVVVYDFASENPYYLTETGTYVQGTYGDDGDPVAPGGAGKFHYGDVVTAVNPVSADDICTWSAEITAKSTQTTSTYKYMCSDSSYQFNVRGDTSLYTSAGDTSSAVQVKFIDGRNNHVVAIEYVNTGRNTMSSLAQNIPVVPFYTVENYTNTTNSNTVSPNGTVTITADTNFIINYSASSQTDSYTINLKDTSGSVVSGYPVSAKYNELVTISVDGAAAFINTVNDKVIAYGSTYSFYACEDLDIQAVASVENEDVYVSVVEPVISNGKVYFIGSFAAPANCKVESYGIVVDTKGTKDNLSLADVNKADSVFNLSASKLTCGNQFVLSASLNNSANSQVKYVAYTIYTVDDVKLIAYSDIVTATLS